AGDGLSPKETCRRIEERLGRGATGRALKAVTRDEFIWMTVEYFIKHTGIIVNFSITTGLGFIVGGAVAGQTFYTFTLENLNQFGSLKAMGVSNLRLVGMVLFQALAVGTLGFCLGAGGAALFGEYVPRVSKLAFYMPWQVLAGTAGAVLL